MTTPSIIDPGSPEAQDVLGLFRIVLLVAGVIFLIVTGLVITIVVRFRRRDGGAMPVQDEGNPRLELVWTVLPFLILVGLFVLTVRVMHAVDPPVRDRQPDLVVTAHQWWWEGNYPATGVRVANEFHLPIGRKLLLRFRSGDVVHDWWVPRLGRKVDVFPNRITYLWMTIDEPGNYRGTCDEFCGAEHAWMRILVQGETPQQYDVWTQAQLRAPAEPTSAAGHRGAELFRTRTCVNCHAVRGISSPRIGPDLTHVATRQTLAAGVLENNAANLAHWIQDPQKIKPDCNMPDEGLTVDEAADIAAYLEELQ